MPRRAGYAAVVILVDHLPLRWHEKLAAQVGASAWRPRCYALGFVESGSWDPPETGLDQVDGGQVLPGHGQLGLGRPVGGQQLPGRGGCEDPPPRPAAGGAVELAQLPAGEHGALDHPPQARWELGQTLGDQPRLADQGPVGPLLGAAPGWGASRPGAVTIRAWATEQLQGHGQEGDVLVCGDLNDTPQAATTQVLLGRPGSAGHRRVQPAGLGRRQPAVEPGPQDARR